MNLQEIFMNCLWGLGIVVLIAMMIIIVCAVWVTVFKQNEGGE